jgi:hypothetical protein
MSESAHITADRAEVDQRYPRSTHRHGTDACVGGRQLSRHAARDGCGQLLRPVPHRHSSTDCHRLIQRQNLPLHRLHSADAHAATAIPGLRGGSRYQHMHAQQGLQEAAGQLPGICRQGQDIQQLPGGHCSQAGAAALDVGSQGEEGRLRLQTGGQRRLATSSERLVLSRCCRWGRCCLATQTAYRSVQHCHEGHKVAASNNRQQLHKTRHHQPPAAAAAIAPPSHLL